MSSFWEPFIIYFMLYIYDITHNLYLLSFHCCFFSHFLFFCGRCNFQINCIWLAEFGNLCADTIIFRFYFCTTSFSRHYQQFFVVCFLALLFIELFFFILQTEKQLHGFGVCLLKAYTLFNLKCLHKFAFQLTTQMINKKWEKKQQWNDKRYKLCVISYI